MKDPETYQLAKRLIPGLRTKTNNQNKGVKKSPENKCKDMIAYDLNDRKF